MIARDGYPFILIGLIVTVILILVSTKWDSGWIFGAAVVFGILTLFTTFFFRDPDRSVPVTPGMLVSPADGKVIRIDTLETHPFVGGPTIKVSIFLSVFDVHVNRIPADGRIEFVKYNPGKFFAAWADKASELNEQTEIGMTTSQGSKIVFKQIAGLIARRIICRLKPEQTVAAGERFGMIRFGSRTELFVPAGSRIDVKVGDMVAGGKTIIGYLAPVVPSNVAPTGLGAERK
ncbi:MAG: phosphatidylserine decarboxylase family protein [Candidatus Zixiibacteriota bacterium]